MVKNKKNIWLGFHNKDRVERINILEENEFLNEETAKILKNNINLSTDIAGKMSENNLGTFSLPLGIAPNFTINGEEFSVPMVTEEPSVVAACSYGAKIISKSGGFTTEIVNREMIGQVILYDVKNIEKAVENILKNKKEILKIANEAHPSIVIRGGGAKDLHVKTIAENPENLKYSSVNDKFLNDKFLVVYLTVDVKEAMGANIINNMLEEIKPFLENITDSTALMGILSNYATESLVTSRCEVDIKFFSNDKKQASEIAEKIQLASEFAKLDIYRASTHNKGIFNGIDAVVIATGNDWRAIEAGGHTYAASSGRYKGLSTWIFDRQNKKLKGKLTLPMPIATVGGSIGLNPSVKAVFNILKNPDAKTLAGIIVSVGLAQNLAALKALVTTGIQKGHMKLQAKSLALSAGATGNEVETVAQKLTEIKYMNLDNAKKILEKIRKNNL